MPSELRPHYGLSGEAKARKPMDELMSKLMSSPEVQAVIKRELEKLMKG